MKNEDSLLFPCLLHHQLPLGTLNKGCPALLLQLTMNKHLVHPPHEGGVGKPPSCTGNSPAEESELCIIPISQGCTDMLLIRFQQLGTTTLLNTENDLGGGGINNGICHVNILCSLPGVGCILSTVASSSTHNQKVNLGSKE